MKARSAMPINPSSRRPAANSPCLGNLGWVSTAQCPNDELLAARRIAEILLGVPLRIDADDRLVVCAPWVADVKPDGRSLPEAGTAPNDSRGPAEPISYRRSREIGSLNFWRELLDRAQQEKTPCESGGPGTLEQMAKDLRKSRKPAVINRRPGEGGKQRSLISTVDHAMSGIDRYGEISWRQASKRAHLGLIEVNPNGNAIIAHRLSGQDIKAGETFVNQLIPNMTLVENYEELEPRFLLFALHMSGTREVRQDRLIPVPSAAKSGERDDINFILDAIHAGWCQHVVWRDLTRLARDVLPGEQIVRHLRDTKTNLWMAEKFGKFDFQRDRLSLRAMNMISAEERDAVVSRLRRGALNKGPLAGKGWTSSAPFGFYRDKAKNLVQDEKQWPFILRAFELAAEGGGEHGEVPLSTRQIARQLAAEDCPIDHDRLNVILRDEIYATGHYVANVSDIPVAQEPVPLKDPVPLAVFHRVQLLLSLRQGAERRTPLGEFLLNYVRVEHEPCNDHRDKYGRRPALKGYVRPRQPDVRRYTHCYTPPDCCKGMSWERADIEHPIVEQVRKLAQDPRLIEQLIVAERHDSAVRVGRLSAEQRLALERELADVEQTIDAMTEEFVREIHKHQQPVAVYRKLIEQSERRREALQRQIEADDRRLLREENVGAERVHQDRLSAFLEIMTLDPPDDPYLKALRARLFQECVSMVRVCYDAEGLEWIEVHGPLVPEVTSDEEQVNPVLRCAYLLDQHTARLERGEPGTVDDVDLDELAGDGDGATSDAGEADLGAEEARAQTALAQIRNKAVCAHPVPGAIPYREAPRADSLIGLPSAEDIDRAKRASLDSTRWRMHGGPTPKTLVSAWHFRFQAKDALGPRLAALSAWDRAQACLLRAQRAYDGDGTISRLAYRAMRRERPELRLLYDVYVVTLAHKNGLEGSFEDVLRSVHIRADRPLPARKDQPLTGMERVRADVRRAQQLSGLADAMPHGVYRGLRADHPELGLVSDRFIYRVAHEHGLPRGFRAVVKALLRFDAQSEQTNTQETPDGACAQSVGGGDTSGGASCAKTSPNESNPNHTEDL